MSLVLRTLLAASAVLATVVLTDAPTARAFSGALQTPLETPDGDVTRAPSGHIGDRGAPLSAAGFELTSTDELDPQGLNDDGGDPSPLAPIVVAASFLVVLILGLRAIRRQRASGVRRRFPPIG